jgi:hypothetical protein
VSLLQRVLAEQSNHPDEAVLLIRGRTVAHRVLPDIGDQPEALSKRSQLLVPESLDRVVLACLAGA